jgi:hypothetical protein
MKSFLVFLFILLVPPFLSTQVRTDSARFSDLLGKDKPQLRKALVGSGSLVESDTKTEYLFVPKKGDASPQASATWTFGDKKLAPQESYLVEVQIGEYEGKRVFLPLRFALNFGPDEINDSVKLLTEAIDESPRILSQFKAQACTHGKKCIKMCKDEKGRSFCCKYVCSSTPQ